MGSVILTQLTRVPAEATVERLKGLGIEAQILDDPNVFTKGSTGGRYLVRVSVDEQDLARAQAELARWEVEAAPRVAALGKTVGRQFLLASLPAFLWIVLTVARVLPREWLFVFPALWLAGLLGVTTWNRWRMPKEPGEGG